MRALLFVTAGLLAANLLACAATPDPMPEPKSESVSGSASEAASSSPGETPRAQSAPVQTPTEVLSEVATQPEATPSGLPVQRGLPPEMRFSLWKDAFVAEMTHRYPTEAVRDMLLGLEFQPQLLERDTSQPEFTRPVWSYLDGAIKPSRVEPGRENLSAFGSVFDAVEARYNVDREVLTAIWGLESQYGTIMGDAPVPSALATFAFEGRRKAMFTSQLEALVKLVAEGKLDPEGLVGSWSGAMGMTQFMPLTMQDYAVDFDGNGRIDLRGSEADALGSAAHYLARSGWVPGQPAMVEVVLPEGFDYGLADGQTQRRAEDWAALGVVPIRPSNASTVFPGNVAFEEAKLLVPAGARGPAFLTFKNFEAILRYNRSTSYAMAIHGLAETFKGNRPVVRDWPRGDEPLSFEDKKRLQQRLSELGYDPGGVDGIVGAGTRRAVRAWQRANGLPADGYVEQGLFRRILGAG